MRKLKLDGKILFLSRDVASVSKSLVKLMSNEGNIIVDIHYDVNEKDCETELGDVNFDEVLVLLELLDERSSTPDSASNVAQVDDCSGIIDVRVGNIETSTADSNVKHLDLSDECVVSED